MSQVTGGRITVRADGDPTLHTMIVSVEALPDGAERRTCRLTSGEECEQNGVDKWRCTATGATFTRIDALSDSDGAKAWPTPRANA